MNTPSNKELKKRAHNIRRNVIKMVGRNGQGYVQQGLGAADLFTYLYLAEARLDPADPEWEARDRIFLSTAHNSAVFHATLAECGFLPEDSLNSYTRDGSKLEINVSERLGPVVEATCGSLGQGLSVATGMAAAARLKNLPCRFHVILGDGELQEGQVWEAAMFAASNGLSNVCLSVDMNDLQVEGRTDNVIAMEPVYEKLSAFGWAVHKVDGHDFDDLRRAFDAARAETGRPTALLVRTLVGKGVPFLEGKMSHNMVLPEDVAAQALDALEGAA